jgi:hypothetical protein
MCRTDLHISNGISIAARPNSALPRQHIDAPLAQMLDTC